MASEKSLEIVRGYIAMGRDGKWQWGKLAAEVLVEEKIEVGIRLGRIQEILTHILRGSYTTREKAWDAAWNAEPAVNRLNCLHVVGLVKFEAEFDLKNRPEPPAKPAPEPKAEGAAEGEKKKGGRKKKEETAGAAPPAAPQAPAAPPAPPAPPVAAGA